MQRPPPVLLALAAFVLAVALSRAVAAAPVVVAVSTRQDRAAGPFVERGLSMAGVVAILGAPGHRLAPDIWVYWDYRSDPPKRDDARYDTLIVTFRSERVAALKLVESATVRGFIVRPATATSGVTADAHR